VTKREMQKLVKRIAAHEPPPITRWKVDLTLLEKTAKRLQRCKDVVRDMKCDPRIN